MNITSTMHHVIEQVHNDFVSATKDPDYRTLISKSHETLMQNASSVRKIDRALVLGETWHIPVELIIRCDRMTFISPHIKTLEKQMGKLPPDLQRRCEIIQSDPSGYLQTFSEMVEEVAARAKTFIEFSWEISTNLRNLPRQPFTVPEKVNFIASFMICGYYDLYLLHYLNHISLVKYGMPWIPSPLQNVTHDNYNMLFARTLAREHLENIACIAEKNATLHVQDYRLKSLSAEFGPNRTMATFFGDEPLNLGPPFFTDRIALKTPSATEVLLHPASRQILAKCEHIRRDASIYTFSPRSAYTFFRLVVRHLPF